MKKAARKMLVKLTRVFFWIKDTYREVEFSSVSDASCQSHDQKNENDSGKRTVKENCDLI